MLKLFAGLALACRAFLSAFGFWLSIAALFAVIAFAASLMFWLSAPSYAAGRMCGLASFYGAESGHRTANGERFTGAGMTAATPHMPFGIFLRVSDVRTGRSVIVRTNDRGPAARTHRIIDLSKAAAQRLGIINRGVAKVCLTPLR